VCSDKNNDSKDYNPFVTNDSVSVSELPSLCINDSTVAGCFKVDDEFCLMVGILGCPLRRVRVIDDGGVPCVLR